MWAFLFLFLVHQAFLCGLCHRGLRENKTDPSPGVSLSLFPSQGPEAPQEVTGPLPLPPGAWAPVQRPCFRGRLDFPSTHGALPSAPLQRPGTGPGPGGSVLPPHRLGTAQWLNQASRPLGSHALSSQLPDMCFSGNTGNYLCPLRKGRDFSACVWEFQTIASFQVSSGPLGWMKEIRGQLKLFGCRRASSVGTSNIKRGTPHPK